MDRIDARILDLLQHNGELTAAEIAERIGLSKTPCWRRIAHLKAIGVIRQTVALLDPKSLNLGTTIFVTVRTGDHSAAWFERFMKVVQDIPEVLEICRMSGEMDYWMHIVVPNADAYDEVYKKLIGAVDFLDINASFVLETIKSTTALPLSYSRTD